jgi:hypothetical protein
MQHVDGKQTCSKKKQDGHAILTWSLACNLDMCCSLDMHLGQAARTSSVYICSMDMQYEYFAQTFSRDRQHKEKMHHEYAA